MEASICSPSASPRWTVCSASRHESPADAQLPPPAFMRRDSESRRAARDGSVTRRTFAPSRHGSLRLCAWLSAVAAWTRCSASRHESPAAYQLQSPAFMRLNRVSSLVRQDRAPTPTARSTSAAGVKPPALPCLCALPHRRSTPFRRRCFAGRRGRRATIKRVALAPPIFTPSPAPTRGRARLSHPGARLASGFIDARVIKSKSYKVPVRAVKNKRPETKPAPARHLDSSSKSGAPRHKVRAADTRARPAGHVGNPSLLRCCGRRAGVALRREQSPYAALRAARTWPRLWRGQTTPAVEAMLPR